MFIHECTGHLRVVNPISIMRNERKDLACNRLQGVPNESTLLGKPASGTRNASASLPSSSANLRAICGEYISSDL
jgi:hypothetical protein